MSDAGDLRESGNAMAAGSGSMDVQTAAAYAFCRAIARREAKNFYWAFRVLPRHKSDAMCAVYAFMRRADDIADDESKPIEARRAEMKSWLEAWRASRISAANPSSPSTTDAPVFLALGHTQRRFNIPDSLLEELVAGTTMDLQEQGSGNRDLRTEDMNDTIQTYANFDELYRYCYLVASVVGLVCIRIFGYTDPRAEKLAEETGVALQLTNILRDVKEDIERGRVYLPLDLLDEFGESIDELRALAAGRAITERERAMLATLAIRAEKYYLAAAKLTPLIDRDSRAALWVLVTIYHRLLARIAARRMEVFGERIALSTAEKLAVLLRGATMAAWNRIVE
jgi:phytoene synthase